MIHCDFDDKCKTAFYQQRFSSYKHNKNELFCEGTNFDSLPFFLSPLILRFLTNNEFAVYLLNRISILICREQDQIFSGSTRGRPSHFFNSAI